MKENNEHCGLVKDWFVKRYEHCAAIIISAFSTFYLQVCLVNDPRNAYNRLLTVEYLSNMVNGRRVLYNNQPVDLLKKLAAASLKDNEVNTQILCCFKYMSQWGMFKSRYLAI